MPEVALLTPADPSIKVFDVFLSHHLKARRDA
jgi:hypothetical protein